MCIENDVSSLSGGLRELAVRLPRDLLWSRRDNEAWRLAFEGAELRVVGAPRQVFNLFLFDFLVCLVVLHSFDRLLEAIDRSPKLIEVLAVHLLQFLLSCSEVMLAHF
jgi:hypothetical protein